MRARDKAFDNYVVTVDVATAASRRSRTARASISSSCATAACIGTQPIPPLGANESYAAAFRVQLPHERKRAAVRGRVPLRARFEERAARELHERERPADRDALMRVRLVRRGADEATVTLVAHAAFPDGPLRLRYPTRTGALLRIDGVVRGAFDGKHADDRSAAAARRRTSSCWRSSAARCRSPGFPPATACAGG